MSDMTGALRLMVVAAHPDDETLGFGGVLARYAIEGIETFVITATRGERGRYLGRPLDNPGHPGRDALSQIREKELLAAAAVLGVRQVSLLGYEDQHLDRVDVAEAVTAIVAHIRRVRPQVLLTFAPDGAYGHPDHIAVSQLATAVPGRVQEARVHGGRRRTPGGPVARVGVDHDYRHACVLADRVARRGVSPVAGRRV